MMWDELEHRFGRRLDQILSKLERMEDFMVDQGTFDAAFTAYIADVDSGVQALVAKANAAVPTVDFSAELAQLDAAKSVFDSAVNPPAVVDTTGVVVGDPSGPQPPDANEQAALDAQAAAAGVNPGSALADSVPALVDGGALTVAPDAPPVSPAADAGTPADGSPVPVAGDASGSVTSAPSDPPAPPV